MAALSIHEPKLVVDVVSVFFDFTSDLLVGETISSAVATISVHTGIDPSPSLLLYQVVTITGAVCEQKIQKGLPGVVYDVLMTIITSTSRTIEQVTRIAILPDANPAVPVYIPLYFTSRPYPVDVTEAYVSAMSLITSGHLLINPYTTEFITSAISITGGSLFGSATTYTIPHEDIQSLSAILGGSLFGGLVSYTIPAEGILPTASMLDGSLYGSIVSYTCPEENITASAQILSGTLT